jgi:hypothetical protein
MPSHEIAKLVDLDALGGSDTPRAQAAVLETEEPSSEYKAADPSESIWVSVDPRAQLVDVEISRTWSERMDPDSFGAALFGAYVGAVQKAAVVEGATREAPPPPPARRPEPTAETLSPDEWLAFLDSKLAEIDAALRAARARIQNVADEEEKEIRGRNGYLTLHLTGGAPTGITGGSGVAHARRDRLREDALDIFSDAGLAVVSEQSEDEDY